MIYKVFLSNDLITHSSPQPFIHFAYSMTGLFFFFLSAQFHQVISNAPSILDSANSTEGGFVQSAAINRGPSVSRKLLNKLTHSH